MKLSKPLSYFATDNSHFRLVRMASSVNSEFLPTTHQDSSEATAVLFHSVMPVNSISQSLICTASLGSVRSSSPLHLSLSKLLTVPQAEKDFPTIQNRTGSGIQQARLQMLNRSKHDTNQFRANRCL